MSKYEFTLKGDFTRLLNFIESQILKGSVSASLEDQSDYDLNGILCAVRVFERYSVIGSNRVSMNLTLLGNGEDLYISAITSGGSQAIFIKINTFGEDAFLDCLISAVKDYQASNIN